MGRTWKHEDEEFQNVKDEAHSIRKQISQARSIAILTPQALEIASTVENILTHRQCLAQACETHSSKAALPRPTFRQLAEEVDPVSRDYVRCMQTFAMRQLDIPPFMSRR